MLKKKLLACGLTMAMVSSLVACGSEESKPSGGDSNVTPTEAAGNQTPSGEGLAAGIEDHSSVDAGSIVSFEDGGMSFLTKNDTDWGRDNDTVVSVQDKFGSKVLHLTRPNGKIPAIAIDVVSLLGDKAAECASISIDIGIDTADGSFVATEGKVVVYSGEDNKLNEKKFNIYKASQAMKTVKIDLGSELVAGAKNYLCLTEIAQEDGKTAPSIVIDNIIFYDKDGKAIAVNSAAEFAVNGVGEYDWSNGVKQPTDEKLLFTGGTTGGGWWPDHTNAWCWSPCESSDNHDHHFTPETAPFGEGDVITVYYTLLDECETWQSVPYLRAQNYTLQDENGNDIDDGSNWSSLDVWNSSAWENWEDDGTPGPDALVNESKNICQIPYKYLVEAIEGAGGDPSVGIGTIDFIGVADRGTHVLINAVTIGKEAQ